jgi:hypothetical protein
MIEGKEHLNIDYYSKYLQYGESINLNESEKQLVEMYFREKLRILPEQKIDFDSPEVLMMVDLIRFTGYLS